MPPAQHRVAQHLATAAGEALELFVPDRKQLGHVLVNHGFEQVFFGGEVQKQGAFGDAGMRGHLFDPGGGKTFFDKQGQGRVEQLSGARLFAPFTLVNSLRSGHGSDVGRGPVVND